MTFVAAPSLAAQLFEIQGDLGGLSAEELRGAWVRLRPIASSYDDGLRWWAGSFADGDSVPGVVDADGGFSVSAPEVGLWVLEVGAPGRLAMRRELVPLIGDVELAPVELPRDVGLAVRVVDPSGAPVPEAHVRIRATAGQTWMRLYHEGWREAARRGLCDERGELSLPRVDGETLRGVAWAPGYLPVQAEVGADGVGSVLRLTPAPARAVRVMDDGGKPLEDVVLRLDGVAVGRSGEAGAAALALPEGEVTLELDAGGGWRGAATWTVRSGEDQPRVLKLPPPRTLIGTVVDAAEETPLAGAVVWLGQEHGLATRSDVRGRFNLVVPPRTESVRAAAAGYEMGSLAVAPWLAGDADPGGPFLALKPTANLAGRVVDLDGAPVVGARIRARSAGFRDRPWQASEIEAEATSRGDGSFRLAGLRGDVSYTLRIEASGFAPLEDTLAVGAEPRTWTLEPGVAVIGRVLDAYGNPVAGARVALFEVGLDGSVRVVLVDGERVCDLETRTDSEGRFEVPDLTPAVYDVEIRAAGWAPWESTALRVGDAGRDLGDLILEPGETLHGRVVGTDGTAIAGARVWLDPVRPKSGRTQGVTWSGDRGGVESGDDGTFRLTDLTPDQEVTVNVEHPDYLGVSRSGVRPGDEPVEIRLEPAARVFGQVVGPAGEPVAGAFVRGEAAALRVLARGESRSLSMLSAVSGDDGRFVLRDVPEGELTLSVSADGLARRKLDPIPIETGDRIGPLRVEMQRGALLTGRVRGADGEPAAGAHVEVQLGNWGSSAVSDEAGHFRLDDLAVGDGRVEATSASREEHTEVAFRVRPGEQSLDLTLQPQSMIRGQVLDAVGQPVAGVRVVVEGPLGDSRRPRLTLSVVSAAEGRFETFRLSGPGRYRLVARNADGYAEQEVEVGSGVLQGVALRLAEAAEVRGQILGLEPAELKQVVVQLQRAGDGGSRISATVSEDGSYVIRSVPPGDWRLVAMHGPTGRSVGADVSPWQAQTVVRDLRFEPAVEGDATLSGVLHVRGEPRGITWLQLKPVDLSTGARMTDVQVAADGSFHAEDLVEGRYEVFVVQGVVAPGPLREIDVEGDQQLLLDLPTVPVAGRLVTAVGTPAAGVRLHLAPLAPHRWAGSTTQYSDSKGRFRFPHVLPGRYHLTYVLDRRVFSPDLPLEVPEEGLTDLELLVE